MFSQAAGSGRGADVAAQSAENVIVNSWSFSAQGDVKAAVHVFTAQSRTCCTARSSIPVNSVSFSKKMANAARSLAPFLCALHGGACSSGRLLYEGTRTSPNRGDPLSSRDGSYAQLRSVWTQ